MGVFDFLDSSKDKKIKASFKKIRTEMDDHLDAINENTNELVSVADYIAELEAKIVKLGERLDEAEMKISDLKKNRTDDIKEEKHFQNIILSAREEEIFLLLYSRNGNLLDYREISKSIGITEEMARKYVSGIIGKGIPIIKKYFENKTFLVLDSDFRNLQAKENIIKFKSRK